MSDVATLCAALIRNACVNDGTPESGSEARSVATLVDFLGEEGRVFEPLPGRGSVVYRLPGPSPEAPALMFLGHLDVVPARPSSWSVDPFAGEIRDGVLWGRGAVDMLNQTAAMAATFRRYLHGELAVPHGDLVFCAVADEEAGGTYGIAHILAADPEAVRCDYVITEIGLPHLTTEQGPGLVVTVGEKGPQWTRLRAAGTPGHASQPYRAAGALRPIATAAARLTDAETPVAITPEWRAFLGAIDIDEAMRARLLDPELLDEAIADLAVDDPAMARWVHACTHLTVAPTVLRGGTKSNIIPDAATLDVDVRALPGQDRTTADDLFRKVLGPDLSEEVEVEPMLSFPATVSPAEGPLWEAMDEAHRRVMGAGRLVPSLIPVSTDARFLRRAGVIAYGAAVFDDYASFSEVLAMYHGNDERVSVSSLELTEAFFTQTVEAFAGR